MEEFLREIQEDAEREKYRVLWKRYGRWVMACACVAIALTIGLQVWKNLALSANIKATDTLFAASTKATPDAWQAAADTLKGNARAMALMHAGRFAEAEESATDAALQSLARAYREDVTPRKDEPFAPLILERLSLAALTKADTETAKQYLAQVSTDDSAPASLRTRTQSISHFIQQHADAFKK